MTYKSAEKGEKTIRKVAHLLSSKGCFAVRLEQTPRFSLLRLLIIRGLLSKHSYNKAGTEEETIEISFR